jgi:hypothetical protein
MAIAFCRVFLQSASLIPLGAILATFVAAPDDSAVQLHVSRVRIRAHSWLGCACRALALAPARAPPGGRRRKVT